ncbi:MAG: response regulator, partial [Clostridia bacterium]|nr:response regulator [Clostridia bacterium]
MIRIMIVDDEKVALDELKFILSAYEDIHVIGAFTDPRKALETILITDVDVVFLDISMPEIDGFMIAEAILK